MAGARSCPNCGSDRPGRFCTHCGQSDRDYSRALRSVAGEFLRETFELDSRLYRSLKLLLFKPGSLTREFSRNRRASYVSPVRLYIFASFLFFVVLSLGSRGGASDPTENPVEVVAVDRSFPQMVLDEFRSPQNVGERHVGTIQIAMFFLFPAFAMALAICYPRRKRFYVDHLVFALHLHTFLALSYSVGLLIPMEPWVRWFRLGCALAPFPYLLIALRRYYEDGWGWTVAKFGGVMTLYALLWVPVLVVAMLITA